MPVRSSTIARFASLAAFLVLTTAACWAAEPKGLSSDSVLKADPAQFRGPAGDGHSAEIDLPTTWSDDENVRWKTDLPGLGWSSPSISKGVIWLTTATVDGDVTTLRVLAIDSKTGRIVRNVPAFEMTDAGKIHSKNSHASPTPVIEGDRVYVHFGSHGTACLSTQGDVLWKARLKYNHRHGPAASPVIFEKLLIIPCDGGDVQYVTALDKQTGVELWKSPREGKMAYCTPSIVSVEGKAQLISPGGEWVHGYDPRTGKELWKVRYPGGYSVVPRPVFGLGMTFVSSGYDNPVLYGIRVDNSEREEGETDVTDTHVAWTLKRNAPLNPSPLLIGAELYVVSDNGVASCLDAKTGEIRWQKRIGGNFSASPLFADGRIHLLDEGGKCTVIRPGLEYDEVAVNSVTVTGKTLASLTAYDRALFLRTNSALLRIERTPAKPASGK